MLFYKNWEVLHNINFTEQCCATASDFRWHFQCITYLISDKPVQSQHVDIYNVSNYVINNISIIYYISIITLLLTL